MRVRAGSNVRAGLYNKAKRSLYRARVWMMSMWKLDFFTTLGVGLIFAFGLNLSDAFGFLVLFQVLHAFLWVGGRALAGTPDLRVSDGMFDLNYVYLMVMLYAVDGLLVVASLVWRIILLVEEHKVGAGTHSDITIVFGWITVGLVAILGLLSGAQALTSFAIYQGLDDRHVRIGTALHRQDMGFLRAQEGEPGQRGGLQTPVNPEERKQRPMEETFQRTAVTESDGSLVAPPQVRNPSVPYLLQQRRWAGPPPIMVQT